MTKTTDKITLKYGGDAVVNGTIDARRLAPSLLEFSKLLDAINNEINAGEPLRIDVAATKEGSFEIDLIVGLINSDNLQIAQNLFTHYKSIKEIVLELFKLKKFLQGKPAKEIIDDPDNKGIQIVTNGDNNQIQVTQNTIIAAKNPEAGEALEKFTTISVSQNGVNEVDIINPDKPEDIIKIPL